MRKLLLLTALLTLTGVPAAGAQGVTTSDVGVRHQAAYPIGNFAPSFGEVTVEGGYVATTLTVTSREPEVSLDPATVTVGLGDWAIEGGPTRVTRTLGPGKSESFEIKAKLPDTAVAGKSYVLTATVGVAGRSGSKTASKSFSLPGLQVVGRLKRANPSLGFRGLRYVAEVRYAGRPLAAKFCTTKALRPTALIQVETGTKRKAKRKKIASGTLAKGTLKHSATKGCRLDFEYFFERRYNGKVGYFTFTFRQSIDAYKDKRLKITDIPGRKIN